ncbi:MAG TPA: VWA domain-containing protein [Phycisphaerae bacterium]|nr:VWA domain-containing protein [Phycisphaerales bacterium]HNO78246.1 VWA domain-containing protein [Phycisphaerae bacterium]
MTERRNLAGNAHRRRGATAVMVAIAIPVIIGFAALTIDVGLIYNTKTDLQRAADAAALAAASRLGDYASGDVMAQGREAAMSITAENRVLNKLITIEDSDITFGRAILNKQTGQFDFVPTNIFPDSARVVVRKTEGSSNGSLNLFFARIFGKNTQDVTAEAIAMLLPRDIAVVADLSGSHSYDSRFQNYKRTDINLYDVWSHLPGGIEDVDSVWADDAAALSDEELAQRAGPAWGFFKRLGYGQQQTPSDYNPNADPGLIKLGYRSNTSNAVLESYLFDQGYSEDEVDVLMSGDQDNNTTAYTYRVAVALGLANWNSGISGGRWESTGGSGGNGNGSIGGNEIVWAEKFGDRSLDESANIWQDYIKNYVQSSRSSMAKANSNMRYQFGLKTFVDYLLNNRASHEQTPELANTPHYPMQAVKDAVSHLTYTIENLHSNDRLSLEIYATRAVHEVDLTNDYEKVSNRLNEMQAAHYTQSTNIGGGILRGIETLTGGNANPASRKVMVLLTDGMANIGCETCTSYDESGGARYAREMAQAAADAGIQIYTVSVGTDADENLMGDIASTSGGTHFHAEGTIDQYSDQLDAVFELIGGSQQVALIK